MLPSSPPPNNADRFPDFREFWDGVPSVGQVFDPHSKAVKPARESAGISGIAVGIASPAIEKKPGGQITARTPDGHSVSLPIAPGTTFYAPGTGDSSNSQLNDLAVAHAGGTYLSAVNTPGVTLVTLNAAPPGDGASQYVRIYGITGGK